MKENKRIAVNTAFLYIKFIITTIVNLVMSRLVLQALGASDYGLYYVVGGIVAMLNTLGTSMIATSYRYMAVEIGKGNSGNPNKVYNTVIVVHLFLAFFLLVFGETFGGYYVNNYLNIDPNKISDAFFILHLSLLTTAFAVITIPMNGLIIAREKFLFTSIVETLASIIKIVFVFFLLKYDGNRLRFYAIMLAFVQFLVPLSYQIYCRIKDAEVIKWKINKNKSDYKELFSFALWILLGTMAVVGKQQGATMIINFFFGTILNAAFGLASQVSHAISSFTSTLRQAVIPQIMKSQGKGNEERSLTLVYAISRYSYLCMNIIAIPILFCLEDVLRMWLGNPPKYTYIFVVFMILNGMVSNLGAGFDASIQATGNIRKNQIGYSIINLSLLPITFVLYKLTFPPYINVIVMLGLTIVVLLFQIKIMTEITNFSIKKYFTITIKPSLNSTLFAVLPLLFIKLFIPKDITYVLIYILFSTIWTCLCVYYWGMSSEEKIKVKKIIFRG